MGSKIEELKAQIAALEAEAAAVAAVDRLFAEGGPLAHLSRDGWELVSKGDNAGRTNDGTVTDAIVRAVGDLTAGGAAARLKDVSAVFGPGRRTNIAAHLGQRKKLFKRVGFGLYALTAEGAERYKRLKGQSAPGHDAAAAGHAVGADGGGVAEPRG